MWLTACCTGQRGYTLKNGIKKCLEVNQGGRQQWLKQPERQELKKHWVISLIGINDIPLIG